MEKIAATPRNRNKPDNLKLSCVLSDSKMSNSSSQFEIELNKKASIRSVKKKISEKIKNLNLKDAGFFDVIYDDKKITNFEQLKLQDILKIKTPETERKNTELSTDELNSLRLKIIPSTEVRNTTSNESKVKYMLECLNHPSENAHYFCCSCEKSFCALCVSEHAKHDFFDKYDYSKSSKEIAENILNNFLFELQEKQKDNYISQYINGNQSCWKNKKSPSKENKKGIQNDSESIENKLDKTIKELSNILEEYKTYSNKKIEDALKEKADDFKENLLKFKLICMNNLSVKNKGCSDVMVLNDDYFKDLHKVKKELNLGKDALLNYLSARNEEFLNDLKENEKFGSEIVKDLLVIIQKIKGEIKPIYQPRLNDSQEMSIISNNTIIENDSMDDSFTIHKEDTIINNNETIPMTQHLKETKKIKNKTNSETSTKIEEMQRPATIESFSIETNQSTLIIKRILGSKILIYNQSNKEFSLIKDFKKDKTKFKKFLQFSVYINVNNSLYISGGKRKDDKFSNAFYKYMPFMNELIVLPSMKIERCSHSMIYINTPKINSEIIVVGGYNTNTCEKYSIINKKWTMLPKLNTEEKQVPTLILINENYLYSIFGFRNIDNDTLEKRSLASFENKFLAERLQLDKEISWEIIQVKNTIKGFDLNLFNVGYICPDRSKNEFIFLGGNNTQNGETNSIFKGEFITEGKNKEIIISEFKGAIPPLNCSFVDKEFLEIKDGKFAQFEMKNNNLIIYNYKKNKFKVKEFKKEEAENA